MAQLTHEKMQKLRERAHSKLMDAAHRSILARVPRLMRAQLDVLMADPREMDKFVRGIGSAQLAHEIIHNSEMGEKEGRDG